MKKFLLPGAVLLACFTTLSSSAAYSDAELEHECTSWMVFNDCTGNNTNILHKNRDSTSKKLIVLSSPAGAKRKWIALGSGDTNSGINSSGLAGAMNSGEVSIDHTTDKSKKGTPSLLRVILDNCDTAAQAAEMLEKLIKAGDYYHANKGSTFFFMDTKEGYICEFTSKVFTTQVYKNGHAVRANIWHNHGMAQRSRNSLGRHLDSSARAYIAFSGLNKIMDEKGKITAFDIFELSRHSKMPKDSPLKRSICFKHTNSASTLELDRQYPDVLSTGYFTVGHPRHTVYIPVPVVADKFLKGMTDNTWGAASFKRFNKLGLNEPLPEKWLEFEKTSMAKYLEVKEQARKLLDDGKRAEAVKLLNDTAMAIWNEEEKVLELK